MKRKRPGRPSSSPSLTVPAVVGADHQGRMPELQLRIGWSALGGGEPRASSAKAGWTEPARPREVPKDPAQDRMQENRRATTSETERRRNRTAGHGMVRDLVWRLLGRLAPADGSGTQAAEPAPAASEGAESAEANQAALRRAFTPTRPVRSARRLAGRRPQLARVLRAIDEEAHVVIYAERGRGKTSLSNLVAEELRARGIMVARYVCSADNDYDAVMRGLMRDLPRSMLAAPIQETDNRLAGCEAALPAGRLQPRDARGLPARLIGGKLVLMVDEFDRVIDEATRTLLADTIKTLSDRASPVLFIIIGVSKNLEELLGRHPSIQRNIIGVPLPLLSEAEVDWLLQNGAEDAGLAFSASVRSAIVALARGIPYTAQLLALHAGFAALARGGRTICGRDLEAAIALAVAEADPRVAGLYEQLTLGGRDGVMVAFLQALAGGVQDAFGRFLVEPAGDGAVRAAGCLARAALWQRLLEADAVRLSGDSAPNLYTMTEATFGSYVLMRALSRGPHGGAGKVKLLQ